MAARKHTPLNAPVATGGVELTPDDLKQAKGIDHAEGCNSPRLTTFDSSNVRGNLIHVVRCVECGALVEQETGEDATIPPPRAARRGR
jgi:hypothetical protein